MIGSILGGAFRLLRQHPLSVLVWSLLYLGGIFAIGLGRVLLLPVAPQSLAGAVLPGIATQALTLALMAILIAAATRATLHPYKRGFCYLRLGANEARMFLLLVLLTIATIVVAFLFALLQGTVLALAGWLGAAPVVQEWIGIVLALAGMAGLVFVQVRLSIALPLTYLYEVLTVDEAWAQSRGHFWSIFGAFVAIGVLLLLGWGMLLSAFFGSILASLVQTGLHPAALSQALLMMAVVAKNLPVAAQLLLIAVSLVLVALGFVLSTATLASAAREMLGLKEGQIEDLRRRR